MNIRAKDLKRYFCVLGTKVQQIFFTYYINDSISNTISTQFYFGDQAETTIPTTIDGKSVTEIGATTFCLKDYVTDVTIDNNIVSIG